MIRLTLEIVAAALLLFCISAASAAFAGSRHKLGIIAGRLPERSVFLPPWNKLRTL